MKRVNKEGPTILGELKLPQKMGTDGIRDIVANNMVVDTAVPKQFAAAHVDGTINIQPKYLAMWGGSLLDYDQPVYLISGSHDLPEVVRILHKIGIDKIAGYFSAEEIINGGFNTGNIPQETPKQIHEKMGTGEVVLVDIRGQSERQAESISGSSTAS